jgi:flagellar hook assembly protein FlgD
LAQNHPNPFNPKTIISYQLAGGSDVELSVYNLLGQKVATVVKQKQASGVYQVEWDASLYASGIYYYKIVAGEFRAVKKMILLK